ncbi:MAG TPA: hypothetical protein PKH33_07310 [bacterium]|nr:hypothetical protein [bacterium]
MNPILVTASAWSRYFSRERSTLKNAIAEAIRLGVVCVNGPIISDLVSRAIDPIDARVLARAMSDVPILEPGMDTWARAGTLRRDLSLLLNRDIGPDAAFNSACSIDLSVAILSVNPLYIDIYNNAPIDIFYMVL